MSSDEKDLFDFELGDNPHIVHRPVRGDRGRIIAAYSIATLRRAARLSREVMWVDEIEKVRAASKAPDSPAWTGWYGEMCKKTVCKRHSKVLPMSSDMDDLLRRDEDEHDPDPDAGDDAGAAPAEALPRRSLTDALNMVAGLEREAGADEALTLTGGGDDDPQGSLIEHEPAKEATSHGT